MFRNDLFYRINVIEIHVPNLQQRREDIALLADYILQRLASEYRMEKPVISTAGLHALRNHNFLGNVRELENILERACALCENNQIEVADLQLPNDATSEVISQSNDDLDTLLDNQEKQIIIDALEKTRWNRTRAAKDLGITLRALRYRLQKLGLDK